ncbi:MAG: DUF4126 domain-containing protein [Thermoanaerobaculales bacterium]
MDVTSAIALPLAAGLVLAAVAGLRAFLPLAVLGLAGRLGWIELGPSFSWLSSAPALLTFWSACLAELLGDKIPVVDHALDAVGTVLRPLAGAVALAAVTTQVGPLWRTVLAIMAGGGAAGLVHLGKAKTRLGSSLLSFGVVNPLLSLGEDILSFGLAILAVLVPILALILLVLIVLGACRLIKWLAHATIFPTGKPATRAAG